MDAILHHLRNFAVNVQDFVHPQSSSRIFTPIPCTGSGCIRVRRLQAKAKVHEKAPESSQMRRCFFRESPRRGQFLRFPFGFAKSFAQRGGHSLVSSLFFLGRVPLDPQPTKKGCSVFPIASGWARRSRLERWLVIHPQF